MKKYIKNYCDYKKIHVGELILCEVCNAPAVDIHHIDARGIGGSSRKDNPENLIALCRECHVKYGDKKQYKDYLRKQNGSKKS